MQVLIRDWAKGIWASAILVGAVLVASLFRDIGVYRLGFCHCLQWFAPCPLHRSLPTFCPPCGTDWGLR
jgi:hypothetical protein